MSNRTLIKECDIQHLVRGIPDSQLAHLMEEYKLKGPLLDVFITIYSYQYTGNVVNITEHMELRGDPRDPTRLISADITISDGLKAYLKGEKEEVPEIQEGLPSFVTGKLLGHCDVTEEQGEYFTKVLMKGVFTLLRTHDVGVTRSTCLSFDGDRVSIEDIYKH